MVSFFPKRLSGGCRAVTDLGEGAGDPGACWAKTDCAVTNRRNGINRAKDIKNPDRIMTLKLKIIAGSYNQRGLRP
jgi:hypothetical protein